MGQLENQVAFITGAARGQGRSHALLLAREGADIIAVDVCRPVETVPYPTATADDLAETARQVKALGRRIVTAEVDVRDLTALTSAVDDGVAQLGRLDIVLANAGISVPAPTLEMSEQTWSTMIDINLTGVWKTCVAAVPHIIAGERGGSVVITSSLAALKANANTAHYSAAKAGLIGFMRVLAQELAPQSIRVNTIHPTTVATDMILNEPTYQLFRPDLGHPTRADFEEAALTLNALPIPALESIDISNAVLYLVSDAGRYITGTTHTVDAGGHL
jgi:SDR family mycofactocin-dependent oxidoreductase